MGQMLSQIDESPVTAEAAKRDPLQAHPPQLVSISAAV